MEPDEQDLERNFKIMDENQSGDIDRREALEYLKGLRLGQGLTDMLPDGKSSLSHIAKEFEMD